MEITTKFDINDYAWYKDPDDHKWYLVQITAINIHRYERPITAELNTCVYYDVLYKEVTGKPKNRPFRPYDREIYDTIPEELLYRRHEDIYKKDTVFNKS